MGYYHYKGVDAKGQITKGVVSADSLDVAKHMIGELKVELITLTQAKKAQKKKITSKDFLTFVGDMNVLLQAGLPIYDALITLEEKYKKGRLYLLYSHLAQRVKQGDTLSRAISQYDANFDPVYLTMLEAGEESGELEQCLQSLAKLIERRQNMSKKVVSALIYPLFLAVFCLVIAFVLFFYLIPSMKEMLLERDLNGLSLSVLSISDFLVSNGQIILLSFVTAVMGLWLFFRHRQGKLMVQAILMRMPIVSSFLKHGALSRFCLVFGVLLKGGLPFVEALKLSKQVMRNAHFEQCMNQAMVGLVQGDKLSVLLKDDPLFPPLFIRMLQVGEASGKMDEMMEKLGALYEEELNKNLFRLISLIQPVLLVVLGMIVAIILLSILLPLTDMSSMM